MVLLLLALAIAPALAIIWYIYTKDEFDKEPTHLLAQAFFLGIFSIIPALIGGSLGELVGIEANESIVLTFLYAFIVVALSEEAAKFLFLRGFLFHKKDFDEPYDGIVYSVMIGMGFATFENILYVLEGGVGVAILRMFTAVPAHAAFGVIMGYYVGRAKFEVTHQHPERRRSLLLQGVFWATVTHGAYDFFLMQQNFEGLAATSLIVLVMAIVFSTKAIALHQASSPFHPDNMETENPLAHLSEPDLSNIDITTKQINPTTDWEEAVDDLLEEKSKDKDWLTAKKQGFIWFHLVVSHFP